MMKPLCGILLSLVLALFLGSCGIMDNCTNQRINFRKTDKIVATDSVSYGDTTVYQPALFQFYDRHIVHQMEKGQYVFNRLDSDSVFFTCNKEVYKLDMYPSYLSFTRTDGKVIRFSVLNSL